MPPVAYCRSLGQAIASSRAGPGFVGTITSAPITSARIASARIASARIASARITSTSMTSTAYRVNQSRLEERHMRMKARAVRKQPDIGRQARKTYAQ